MRRLLLLITNILYLLPLLYSQSGTFFIKNYSPEKYNGSNQVWGIVQDNRGIMYFAADQILEYDGVNWRKIPLSNSQTVRSLAIDTVTNIIYVGGVNEFGCLVPDSTGNLVYKSLSLNLDSTNINFNDVWRTEVCNGEAYFSTNTTLFKYSLNQELKGNNPLTIWKESSFFLLYKVGNKVFTGVRGKGIVEIKNDSLIPLDKGNGLLQNMSWFMLPYQKNKYLIGNTGGGLQVFDPQNITLSKTQYFNDSDIKKTDSIIYKNQLYGGTYLGNNMYALATIRNGILIVNEKGKIINTINKQFGLQSQTVHYLYKDKNGGLWAALTYGISHIEINTPITHFNDLTGLEGSIYNAIRSNGEIYASSNLGLFKKSGEIFIPVKGISGKDAMQCFGLNNIKQGDKTVLLAATTRGLYTVEGVNSKKVFNIESFSNYQLPSDSNILLLSENNIIFVTKYINNKWEIIQKIELDSDASSFYETDSSKILFLKENEIFSLKLENNYTSHSKITKLETNDSLEFIDIKTIDNNPIFITNKGLYLYKNHKFIKDDLIFNGILKNEKNIQYLEAVNDNQIWIKIKRDRQNIIKIIHKKADKYYIDSISFKRLPPYDDFITDGDSLMWVISAQALYRIDTKKLHDNFKKEDVLTRLIKINNDSIVFNGAFYTTKNNIKYIIQTQTKDIIPEFNYEFNNITFEYALPSYDNEKNNLYSYCLIRNNEECVWSDWTNETKKEYTNLKEGHYIFKVRAKNTYCQESSVSEFNFIVKPPWYRTIWAFILYFVLSIFVIYISIQFYTRKLKKEKERLEIIVRERTQEIWEKKEEIEQQANNLKEANNELLFKNQEINQQNAEISAQRDNLQELTDDLHQRTEEIRVQNEELAKQKEVLETINTDVHDSIEYAFRIQNAALPPKQILDNVVEESFILFKPKDLVSGDFYWFANFENTTVITAADCTGHGVPGALMSILGIAILKEVVIGEFITHPGVILRKLRKGIISSLNQKQDSIEKDGMDMALISINSDEKLIQYSGANNPLYIVRPIENCDEEYEFMIEFDRNEKYVLYEIKPDKMPISIYLRMDRFNTHEFNYKSGDILYLFSDGYADQFGGKKAKKFKYKPFKNLILKNANKSLNEQKECLDTAFNNWKGSLEQIDDVVIIGLKL